MLILELFDKTHPWNWTRQSPDRFEAIFEANGGKIVVEFVPLDDTYWEFSFEFVPGDGEGTTLKTGMGDEFVIWSTVIDIAKNFTANNGINGLILSSLKREPSRVKLFDRLWNKVFGKEWNIDRKERGAAVEYIMTRK